MFHAHSFADLYADGEDGTVCVFVALRAVELEWMWGVVTVLLLLTLADSVFRPRSSGIHSVVDSNAIIPLCVWSAAARRI
jgi:hypothetical protein